MKTEKTFTTSSTVKAIYYEPTTQDMTVVFTTNKSYNYAGVPESVWKAALDAESIGSFISTYIKGKYPYKLIN